MDRERWMDLGLFVLRVGLGGLLVLIHGGTELFGGVDEWRRTGQLLYDVFGVQSGQTMFGFLIVMTRFLGGICMILGLFFRPFVLMVFLTMVLKTVGLLFQGASLWSLSFQIDLVVVFAGLVVAGPGRLSLDVVLDGVFTAD